MLGLADRAPDHRPVRDAIAQGQGGRGHQRLPRAATAWAPIRRRGDARPAGALPTAASVAKALGPDALGLPKDQAARLAALGAAALGRDAVARSGRCCSRAYEEARRAPDPAAAVEMALIRLATPPTCPDPRRRCRAIRRRRRRASRAAAPARAGRSGGGKSAPWRPSRRPWLRRRHRLDRAALVRGRRRT